MTGIQTFIRQSADTFSNISYFDSVRSSLLIYLLIGMVVLLIGMIVVFSAGHAGLRDGKLVLLLFGVLFFTAWSWVKLYQYWELHTSLKTKAFDYRLAAGLQAVLSGLDASGNELERVAVRGILKRNYVKISVRAKGKNHPLRICYTQDLTANMGKLIVGTPLGIPGRINPRTWFLSIEGNTAIFEDRSVTCEFSARKDDHDRYGGYGVRLYDSVTFEEISPKSPAQKKFLQDIKKAIEGTLLKGRIDFDRGRFTLKIYDNILVRKWRRPVIQYKTYQSASGVPGGGTHEEKAGFVGADKVLSLLLD